MSLSLQPDQLWRAFSPVLPAVGIRASPDDFVVKEDPAYDPCGSGEHLFLQIEKRDVSAGHLLKMLTQMCGIKPRDIGTAGQKDRRAVTCQQVSVPRRTFAKLTSRVDQQLRILDATPHTNKLRTGHLKGNWFRIVLRPVSGTSFSPSSLEHVRGRLVELEQRGFPNYFGPQRFGHDGNSLQQGLALLDPAQPNPQWSPHQRRFMKKMVISAVQSEIFNRVLTERVRQDSFRSPRSGDVVCRRGGTRPFAFESRGSTPSHDCVPMGPLPGPKMLPATDDTADSELSAWRDLGIPYNAFDRFAKLAPGTRRSFVAIPKDTRAEATADGGIACEFLLPPGSYATVLLMELCEELDDS